MLTLQAHQQVVYQLSQLSNCFSATTTDLVKRLETLYASKVKTQNNVLCSESLEECARNCSSKMVLNLPKICRRTALDKKRFRSMTTASEIEYEIIVQLLSPVKPVRPLRQYPAPWETSFISADTFEENKRLGFQKVPGVQINTSAHILSASRNLYPLLPQTNTLALQKRGFKTERMLEKEKEKNIGFLASLVRSHKADVKGAPGLDKLSDTKTVEALSSAWVTIFKAGEATGKKKAYITSLILCSVVLMVVYAGVKFFLNGLFVREAGKQASPEEIDVTFDDVRGNEEVKKELRTVVSFLKDPKKFAALGAKLPKGVLLVGEPGVGKTLLARAVAGEAQVPFFFASGSEFDELLVGEGARRIRNLFRNAKENAPCVIFLDEIDSVGAQRTKSSIHPYANQSINQLLSEMDGFQANEGVVVLAATNRGTELDKALIRPGRFDMSIQVPVPNKKDRRDIIQYYLQKIACRNIDIEIIVKLTGGWNGANLKNLLNLAAIIAATENAEYVSMQHIINAFDRIVLGLSWGETNVNENLKESRRVAYHEAGHTLVALFTPGCHPVHKVTIEARGSTGGHTAFIPDNEGLLTKAELEAQLDSSFGGQVAEELIYGTDEVSTGCSSDLEHATNIATSMVRRYGMGVVNRVIPESQSLSVEAQGKIDTDIDRVLNESKERAKNVLSDHIADLHKIAAALLECKTLSRSDIMLILGKSDEVTVSKN